MHLRKFRTNSMGFRRPAHISDHRGKSHANRAAHQPRKRADQRAREDPITAAKVRNFSRLPLVATGGVIGPLLQAALAHRVVVDGGVWGRFPILSSQLVCAGLMFVIFLANVVFLKEVSECRASGF